MTINVRTSTVSDWVKSKEKLVNYTKKQGNWSSYKPKIIKIPVYEAITETCDLRNEGKNEFQFILSE